MEKAVKTYEFKRVLVWELPVRFCHWINALSIFILAVTGFIIADPPAIMSGAEASDSYWFGTVRAIHFITAYVFLLSTIVRLYWAFNGNYYANWRRFFPFDKRAWDNVKHVLKIDVLLQNEEKEVLKNISVGHNYLASLSYLAWLWFRFSQALDYTPLLLAGGYLSFLPGCLTSWEVISQPGRYIMYVPGYSYCLQ